MAHALNTLHCRIALRTRVNPDTTGCEGTGEFDLNMLRVDGDIFNPKRKNCGLKNIRICVDGALVERSVFQEARVPLTVDV